MVKLIENRILLNQFFLICLFYIISSCSHSNPKQQTITQKNDTLKPPVIIPVKNPAIINLDTCPQPNVIYIPTNRGISHTVKDDAGLESQERLFPPKTFAIDFYLQMQNYNTEQGLAFSSVLSSYCDRKGNLWFGTNGNGISRYDGKSFTNFTNIAALYNTAIYSIAEDNNGNLWFGTSGTGVVRYDGKSFTSFTTTNGLANDNVYYVFEDKEGNLWFATNGGVSKLENGKKSLPVEKVIFLNYTVANGLVSNNVAGIAEDKKGNLWFGTSDSGVSRYNGKSFTSFTINEGLINNSIYGVLADRDDNLWFASPQGGISRYDGKLFTNYTTKQGLVSNYTTGIFEEKNGDLWFETRGQGVYRLDYNKKTLVHYTTKQGLVSDNIWSMTQDKAGNLWFSSFGSGIGRLTSNITYSDFLLQSIFEDKDGYLWLGSDGGGLSRLSRDKKFEVNYNIHQGLINNHVHSVTEDKDGNIWFGTFAGAAKLDQNEKSFTTYTSAQGLASNAVNRIYKDYSENIWFGTSGGLSKLDSNLKTFTSYTTEQGLVGNYVSGILKDNKKNIWVCTDSGISKFNGKAFTNYTTAQGLANNNVVNVIEDKKGNLWFAVYGGGLSRLDNEQKAFINYTTEQGLGDDNVTAIAMDASGIIWLGTLKGFTALKGFSKQTDGNSKKDFIPPSTHLSNKQIEAEGYKPVFEVYNNSTGYPVKDINGNALFISHDDIIWAGTSEKLFRFDHSGIYKNNDTPNIFIQTVKVNNENICWYDIEKNIEKTNNNVTPPNIIEEITLFGKTLNETQRDTMRRKYNDVKFDSIAAFYPVPLNLILPYKHNEITFDFAAIEPSRPDLVRYQYILEGYNNDWSVESNETSASFGNIHEGNYTFKLKAQSPDGIWSESIVYTFKVLPPWYRTWWAYTLYILTFLVALWSFIKWRERTMKKEKVILENKVALRTHELKEEKEKVESTLSELKSTQAQLIQSEKMASLGELTAGIAHEIQNPLNFVNNFSEVNKEMLEELKAERLKPKAERDEQTENEIINDVIDNEEKINHHGKRADAIVKGMLQHSRKNTGVKEPTDINALCDEYLRLSYHGMRAKDKSFNADIKTDFDASIGKINIVPQDIGRVLLNLFNNAFYAVSKPSDSLKEEQYKPLVSVTTKAIKPPLGGLGVEIVVTDNGNGISQNIIDKIFQPFFTTKPTGEGTGLGLSLAYDIITKQHGGSVIVKSQEGKYAEFIVTLPSV